jgi:hypothetical protein
MAGAVEAAIMAAEGRGPLLYARVGVLRALNRHVERVFNPCRKDRHWRDRKLGRLMPQGDPHANSGITNPSRVCDEILPRRSSKFFRGPKGCCNPLSALTVTFKKKKRGINRATFDFGCSRHPLDHWHSHG